ncbi:hypothetical protein HDV05_008258 [Chytridiales sp. JEL 0842]|nr:hypothetical protein HDV05_008258 [Chytridiales sp. JEL 0842]
MNRVPIITAPATPRLDMSSLKVHHPLKADSDTCCARAIGNEPGSNTSPDSVKLQWPETKPCFAQNANEPDNLSGQYSLSCSDNTITIIVPPSISGNAQEAINSRRGYRTFVRSHRGSRSDSAANYQLPRIKPNPSAMHCYPPFSTAIQPGHHTHHSYPQQQQGSAAQSSAIPSTLMIDALLKSFAEAESAGQLSAVGLAQSIQRQGLNQYNKRAGNQSQHDASASASIQQDLGATGEAKPALKRKRDSVEEVYGTSAEGEQVGPFEKKKRVYKRRAPKNFTANTESLPPVPPTIIPCTSFPRIPGLGRLVTKRMWKELFGACGYAAPQ